ncbi:terminase small subunit [Cetobacterium sp.]|uniref:terminase small subunit n=1 Tax=Cetobacterium sp. TaxID=2071632 RepID=UPI003F349213
MKNSSLIFPPLKEVLNNASEVPKERISTPEKFYKCVQNYYEMCNANSREVVTNKGIQFIDKPFTISGLCISLGITKTRLMALSRIPEYKEIVEFCFLLSENYLEEGMLNGKINTLGSMFALKNNFGWRDNKAENSDRSIVINVVGNEDTVKTAELVNDQDTIKQLEKSGLNFDMEDN